MLEHHSIPFLIAAFTWLAIQRSPFKVRILRRRKIRVLLSAVLFVTGTARLRNSGNKQAILTLFTMGLLLQQLFSRETRYVSNLDRVGRPVGSQNTSGFEEYDVIIVGGGTRSPRCW